MRAGSLDRGKLDSYCFQLTYKVYAYVLRFYWCWPHFDIAVGLSIQHGLCPHQLDSQ